MNLCDPSVHREVDAYVEHLVWMLDEDEADFETEELWAGNRSSRGGGDDLLPEAPPATFPGRR